MVQETKHTDPTLWEAAGHTIMGGDHMLFVTVDSTFNGESISDDEQTANVEFAVRAVKAHDELVSLIEDLMKWDEAMIRDEYQLDVDQPTIDRAKAVLAKARGEA